MQVENTPLLVHIWGITGLGSIFCGGGTRRVRFRSKSILFPPFFAVVSAFPGFRTFLGFFPVLLGYDPFSIDAKKRPTNQFLASKVKIATHPFIPLICHHFVPPTISFVVASPPRASIRCSAA